MREKVVLFDFDGVIMDTESIYSKFWDKKGKEYLGIDNFGTQIKGMTDKNLYEKYFFNHAHLIPLLDSALQELESNMPFTYVSGAESLLKNLKQNKVRIALVTSSSNRKMRLVAKRHPNLLPAMDCIITSDKITHSKPHPECFQKALEYFNVEPSDALVFEDSIYGLQAARSANCMAVGVATTNTKEELAPLCDWVVDNLEGIDSLWIHKFMCTRNT